ncbi:right-handed parallel beta-helix repeat-containing protein [Gemmiger sp.]|uniref:right-handed parallel beta-helix repeat-containing protein n=1 Tax=Gemmiger sp. TaxID=2049027 RepID=UPI003AF93A33
MKKKSIQRIAAWLLAAGMMAGTFAQPMAVYAESAASIAASDSTTGDSITADADVVIATPTPEPDTGTDTAATPVPTADSQTPQDPASTAAPETTPAPDAAEDAPTPTPTPAAEDTADDAADTDDTTDTTTTVTPADLQSCIALLAASQLSLDADSIEPDVREETLALSDEITETEPSTLQAVVNAAVFAAPADQTDINVDVPAGNYTGTLVIPDATIVVKDASGKEININYTNKNIILNMTGSTLTVPTDAAVGVSVFGSLTIQGGTIKAADGCTATRGVQVQLGSTLTLDGTTISDFTYAGPGAGVYVKGTAAVDTNGQFDVALGDNQEPLQNADNTYQFKKLQRENGSSMDTSFTMKGNTTITNCKSDGNGAALYVHNAALLTLESANFTNNNAGGFGGAVYLGTGVQTTIGNDVTFTGNHAAKDGGALYLANQYTLHVKADNILVQVPVTFNGGTFTDNSTDTYGGALAFDSAFDGIADNTIENVTFGQAETTTSEEEDAEKETILHGNYAALRGGAIAFNSNIKENTLKNCTFRGNTALRYAGAVYYPNNYSKTSDFTPVYKVDGCTFDRNSATYDEKNGNDAGGGAITIQVNPVETPNTVQVASLYVKNSAFTGNTATGYGGAISTRRETGYGNARIYLNIDGSNFDSNRVTSAGNGGWRGGGAVWVSGCAWADFTANTFTGNYSAHFGGAIASNNDNVYQGRVITLGVLREDGTPDPDKANTFTNNSANSWGGAISTGANSSGDNTNGIYTTVRIYGGSFAGNTTLWGSGGALYVDSGTQRNDLGLEVVGATFTGNQAKNSSSSGAVRIYGVPTSFKDCEFTNNTTEQSHGGAIWVNRTKRFDMDNVTFTGNTAGAVRNDGWGGAVFINEIPSSFGAAFTWNNVTFKDNTSRSHGGAVGINTNVYLTLNATNITASNNKSISLNGGAFYLSQGRYTLTNAVFENNIAGYNGGAIYVWNQYSGNSLTINGNSSFAGNTANNSGGAVQFESNNQYRTGADGNLEYYRGELNIIGTADNPIVFRNNTAKNYSGGALCIGAHNTDKLDYLDVHDNTALRYGGGIYINNSTTEGTLTNSKIHNNTTSWAGGGVDIHNYLDYQETKVNNATVITRTGRPGDFTIRDCEITGNSTTGTDGNSIGGGGISITSDLRRSELYKEDSGTVNIIDTVVKDNTTTLAGGGIYCGYNGTNNISGGSISNNTSGITATTAIDAVNKYKYGGGAVAVRNNTTTIKGGTVIAGNTSGVDGGALYVKNADSRVLPASLTTEDCEIKNNTAKKGGIAYVSAGASFAMGEKTSPDSNEGVGDVFVEKSAGEVTLPAAKKLEGKYDAWLMDDATPIEKAVTNDSSAEHYYTLQGAAHVVARLNGLLGGSWTGKEYTTLQAALDEAAKKNGTASIDLLADVGEQVTATTENNPITLNLNGYTLTGKITLTNGQNTNAFTLTDEKADDYKAGSAGGVLTGPANGIEMNNGTRSAHNTLILTGKTLTLRNLSRAVNGQDYIDITAKDVTFTGNTDSGIRLNGSYHNIVAEGAVFTKSTGYSILTNGNYSTVALKDVEIYDNSGTNSGRVYVNSNSTVTVDGGKFHDNITTSQSGGVIDSVGWTNTITINGGEFYNNKAVNGGVVYLVYTGNVTINDGKFYNNTATSNGGALAAGNRAVILTINDGEFYNNTANNGGAVYMNTDVGLSTLNMTGGEIYNNTANNGGALYIATKAKVTLSAAEGADVGGIIRDNAASQLASNLYLGGADSSLTVGEKTLLHGGTIAGDVLFAQGGTVDLADTQALYTKGIEDAENLVWLKNDNETGVKAVREPAKSQTIYTLAPAGENTGSYAARIGSDKYFSINQAIKAMEAADAEDAETNTTTIHLLRDQTEDVTINNTKHSPTLNLNGYTLTGHITVNDLNHVGRTFTLTDDNTQADYNKAGKGGTLTAASGTLVNIKNQSNRPENITVKLQGVTLTGSTRGVYAGSNVNLVAEGSSFSGLTVTTVNTNGAAISYGGVGTLVVNNCKFADNRVTANGHAGAIYMNSASGKATITNSTFTNNQSKSNYGGAMWLAAHSITLRGNKFAGNTAGAYGGAIYLGPCANTEKAGSSNNYGSYDAVLENNTFKNNKAYIAGGALYINPSAITVTTLLDHCTFTNNSTTTAQGGAVYQYNGTLTLGTDNRFEENKSYGGGSAMFANGNLLSVRDQAGVTLPESGYDTQFIHNTSGYGNYNGGSAALYLGGGATKNMRYMLFDRNVAAYGNTASAIYISTGSASTAQRVMWIDHCRFENNVGNRYTVYVDTNYTNKNLLKINNTVFDNNTVKYGRTDGDAALLYIAYGNSVEMSDCTITKTQGEGRVLRYYGGGTLDEGGNAVPATGTFTNVTITDNKNCYYTPVSLPNANRADSDEWKKLSIQAQSTWKDCTITGNAASITSQDGAGGFEVYKQNVTLEHCTISNNSGPNGGVYVSSPLTNYGFGDQQEGVVTFTNCCITGNHGTAARGAGGMGISYYQSVRGIVNLTDCTIKDNTGNYGGGIRVGGNDNDDWNASGLGTLNATNCTISGNTATVKGGGIFASAYDTKDGESRLHLTDCTITNNTANYGGGIYAARQIKPEKRNKDSQYRDYYVNHAADTQTMIVTRGTIADNIAQKYGGGISTDVVGKSTNYNTLIVKVADGTVENNRAQLGQDVYAYKTKADTVLHLPQASAIHDNGRWLNENTSETLKDEAIDYDPIQRTYPLTLSVPKVETKVAQIVGTDVIYNSLQEAMDAARAMLAEDPNQKLTVQLLTNTNSSTQISQDTNVTLDLAGHTITGIGGKPALTVESDVAIIGGGTISGTATDGGALLLRNNANVTMTNTTITNSRAAYRGGAVCVDSGSSFTLGGGSTITGCQAGRGGAVYVIDGSFAQTDDAVITNCSVFENAAFSACGYGGAVYVAKGSYTLQSGSVTNNSATQNGIIYIANNSGAEFTMTKGKISGNTCKNGTIYQAGGTMTLAGGSITGNTCTESGGGVYQNGGSSLLLGNTHASQDVVISGNKAVNGAGWYINGGNCLMRGGNITGNKATKRGGGVCQSNGTLTVNGGDITTNNAPEGGGLCHSGGTFNFQGGGLYGNIATGDDGGNDVYSTSKNGVMDLIAAAAMDSDKYNVWRDDYYPYTFTKKYHNTSDKIAAEGTEDGGKYLTSTVPNVNNVKLTADYYENSNIEIESNDMYIYRMSITKQDTGDGEKDYYDAEDGVITAADVMNGVKADNVESVVPTGKTYPLNYDKEIQADVKTEEALMVTYKDGSTETVRPVTPVQWTAGSDATKDNALIRSFSTANYIVSLDTKSQEKNEQLVGATERLWMRIKVPCESGEISLSGKGTVFKSSYTYYDPESHCQILEGYQDHVIEEQDLGAMNMTMQFSIKVGGMHNGTTVQPTIEAWFDNSSYQSYRTKTNPYDDRVVLDANTMRVSAKAAYNLSVTNNPSLRHIGYFDMDTKTEITEQQYNEKRENNPNSNVVYGMMVGYGMSLQLRNQDTSKGLRGIEVPSRDITFDVNMQGGLKFNGKTVYYAEGGQPVAINPLLWAYKPNESGSYTGYDTRNNTAGINMNWSDEDDDDRSTHYDSKIAMNVDENHSGGTWTALDPDENSTFTRGDGTVVKQTKLTFKVSGYTMRPISKSNDPAYSFSTGYLQVLIPLELDKYDFAKNDGYEGFLQTDMHMAGGNMTMDTTEDLNGVEAELTDKVNGYFNYTDEGILRSYAKNESTYYDNYDNSSTLGMNISRGWGGNASYITKTNYWLGSDGKTVLNDDQNKQLGTNVTGIASMVYMTGNLDFGSEVVTPANNTDTFIYDAQVDQQAEYYYLTAYDVLMKFDPSAMRPATYMVDGVEKPVYKMSQQEVAANLKDVTHISLSDNGYSEWDTTRQLTQNYELTILYAAKANDTPVLKDGSEGNGWQYARWARADGAGLDNSQPLWDKEKNTRDNGGTADMDKYSFNDMEMTVGSDGATKEIKGLVYYDTLTELEKAGHTCVAVLYQIRNCCVRTGRSVEIGHMMEVTKDVSKIGRSYALTMDVRGWTTYRPFYRSATATGSNPGWTRLMDNGTVLTKRSELLYQGLIEGKGEQANAPVSHPLTSAKNSKINWDIGTPTISRITNNYQKTQYSNGYEVGGSHSGYLSGNTVLLATQNATVEIETTDVAEGNIRQTDYQLDEGQRTVTVQVTPGVTMQSNAKANLEVFDGTTQTDLTLDVKLPQDLTLQEGTLTFDYSNSSYNRGDLTWEAKYQYWNGTTWQNFDFKTNYEQDYVQQPTRLHLTTTITDVKKVLPVLSFKAGIGYPADPDRDIKDERDQDGAWYKNLRIDAEIHTTYEEEDVNASLGRTDYTEIKVLRNSKTVVNKTAASNLVEIGDVLAYDLTYINEGGANSDLELCDLLPYNTEKAKTFHGAYGLKSVTVTVQNADGSAINLGTDDITVKYAGTDSVAYTNKDVLDRAATMKNAESGTSLTTKTTQGNSVTFTPDTMPIHKATGTSKLGSLYLQLKGLPNATVKVHVKLAVTQTKDGVNALLTDIDDKTVQQSNDTYNNIYFARAGGKNNALLTSPTASIKVRSRSISGLVWMDQNYDGIYTTKLDDTGKKNVGSDKTLAGITVTLVQTKPNTQGEKPVYIDGGNSYYAVTDTLGNKVQPVTTKKDGRYTFENLKQGNYRVLFTDSKDGYMMEDDSKPVLPFGKLSVTKHDATMGDTSNKTAPQYGTEDANTLQAAMSREITLGDAVLTGRDDKTNINAGFYYTELRLAKVWQNIPDAKKAAEAKVDFTLAATQDENELEEAVYTLSNTAVSKPAKADENAENLTLFGTFVGDKVDVTDDSDERTVRWQTTQGLPLQAENANGPITYTLKQDTVRADGDTWIGNVSFVQQQNTEKVSSGAESDNSVIATRLVAVNTARTYEILIHKLSDVENKELEQAEFTATLQPANLPEKLLGGKVEIKSQQTIQRTGENKETEEIRYRLTDLTAGTYTLAETKAPLGYAKDPVKYKLTITDRDKTGNTLPIITLEDDKGILLYTAKMTPEQEAGDYSVDVTAGDGRDTSTASAVMTAGSCLEKMPKTEQEQSNLPIRTQISMEITDSYLFSLPFTGGSGMNRSLLQGVAVMALAAAAFAVTAIHRKKKNHS